MYISNYITNIRHKIFSHSLVATLLSYISVSRQKHILQKYEIDFLHLLSTA